MARQKFSHSPIALGRSLRSEVNIRYHRIGGDSNFTFALVDDGFSAPSGTTGKTNIARNDDGTLSWTVLGTQTVKSPTNTFPGITLTQDTDDNDGAEWNENGLDATGVFNAGGYGEIAHGKFIAGTDAFFFRANLYVGAFTETDEVLVGFRKAALHQADYLAYTDFAYIGLDNALNRINILTKLRGGAVITTDTSQQWVNVATDFHVHSVEVRVDSTGRVAFLIDDVFAGVQQPTSNFSFAAGDTVIPSLRYRNATGDGSPNPAVTLLSWESGLWEARDITELFDVRGPKQTSPLSG